MPHAKLPSEALPPPWALSGSRTLVLSLSGNPRLFSFKFPLGEKQFLLSFLLHTFFKSLQLFCPTSPPRWGNSLLPAQMKWGEGKIQGEKHKWIFPKLLLPLKMLRSYNASVTFLPIFPNLNLTMNKQEMQIDGQSTKQLPVLFKMPLWRKMASICSEIQKTQKDRASKCSGGLELKPGSEKQMLERTLLRWLLKFQYPLPIVQ